MRTLKPVRIRTDDYDKIEERLKKHFKKMLYEPLAEEIRKVTKVALKNSKDPLADAFKSGRLYYDNGFVKGNFNSTLSKKIDSLGGKWSKSQAGYQLPLDQMGPAVKSAIEASLSMYEKTVTALDAKLRKILPEEISDTIGFNDLISDSVHKMDLDLRESLKSITVSPEFSDEQLKRIADEYTLNMQRYIRDWTEKEIQELRNRVQKQTLTGKRFGDLAKVIERSYGVSQNKAKFLARQETHLYLAKVKETRYKEAGVEQYIWKTVVGSSAHPVRPAHKELDGKIFDWNNPPITSEPGQAVRRNHPGEDFNCRCTAIPVVRF